MKCIRIWVGVSLVCLFSVAGVQAQAPVSAEPESPRAIQVPLGGMAEARVLRLVKFTGELRDAMGRPQTGVLGVTFALYEQQEGGTPRWLETQNIELDAQGRYSVLLGVTRSEGLPLELFTSGQARWLGIQVENESEQPRVLLVSVPYALKAADADTLGGRPASAFVLAQPEGEPAAAGSGTTGSGQSQSTIESGRRIVSQIAAVSGTGTPNKLPKWLDTFGALGDSAIFESGGLVGINTTAPGYPLTVLGAGAHKIAAIGPAGGNVISTFVEGTNQRASLYVKPGGLATLEGWEDGVGPLNFGLNPVGGNVGIGTTAPGFPLTVTGTSSAHQIVAIGPAGSNVISTFVQGTNQRASLYVKPGGLATLEGWEDGVGPLNFGLNPVGGNVGIGTTTPTEKLDVAGNLKVSGSILNPFGAITAGSDSSFSGTNGTGSILSVTQGSAGGTAIDLRNVAGGMILTGRSGTSLAQVFSVDGSGNVTFSGSVTSSGLRVQPTATDPNIIAGLNLNTVTAGVVGATIAGGGDTFFGGNFVTDDFGTVGGGNGNVAGDFLGTTSDRRWATVCGGSTNRARGQMSVVAGGGSNTASGGATVVGGGVQNVASGGSATIGGGQNNLASGDNTTIGGGVGNVASAEQAAIGGGGGNTATGFWATVGGGQGNSANAFKATIAGGGRTNDADVATGNRVTDDFGTVGGGGNNQAGDNAGTSFDSQFPTVAGGFSNTASGSFATVGGGYSNVASNQWATVGGGRSNTANKEYTTVAGGQSNVASGSTASTVGGGFINTASGGAATISGGGGNTASGGSSTIGGGFNNNAFGQNATVGGGGSNSASGSYATTPGGASNSAAGATSFAAGNRAKANHDGAFVWGDSTAADIASSGANQFIARASGGVTFYSNSGLTTGVTLAAGGGSWSSISDRNSKENFAPVAGPALLARLNEVPILTWNYRSQAPSILHMGPMAQDFRAAFGLGEDDKHITTIDADGVALAAIQALYRLSLQKDEEIRQLRRELEELRGLVRQVAAGQQFVERAAR